MERFGEKLRTLREKRGLSYRQLGAELEVAHGHLAGIESGASMPSIALVLRISIFFNVSLDRCHSHRHARRPRTAAKVIDPRREARKGH